MAEHIPDICAQAAVADRTTLGYIVYMNQLTSYMKSIWSRITGAHQVSHEKVARKVGLRPGEDWLVILGFFAVMFLLSAGAAFYMYIDVINGAFVPMLPSQSVSQSPTLNASQLQAVESYFASKQVATSTPSDPSK